MTVTCTSVYQQPPPYSLTTRPTIPDRPTSRLTRPTTKRPPTTPIPATRETTRRPFVSTKLSQQGSSTVSSMSTKPQGHKTTDGDATNHTPTSRTQPVLADKGRKDFFFYYVLSTIIYDYNLTERRRVMSGSVQNRCLE